MIAKYLARAFLQVQWRPVLAAAALTALATFPAFLYGAINLTQLLYEAIAQAEMPIEMQRAAGDFVATYITPVVFLVGVIALGSSTASKTMDAPWANGLAVGLLSAVLLQVLLHFLAEGILYSELFIYLLLGLLGGVAAGWAATRNITARLASNRASSQLRSAANAHEVVEAIGKNMGGPQVEQVLAWLPCGRTDAGKEWELIASWVRSDDYTRTIGSTLTTRDCPALSGLTDDTPVWDRYRTVPWGTSKDTDDTGKHPALLVPMPLSETAPLGVLMVLMRRRTRLGRGTLADYLTVCNQAGLILENIRLNRENREAVLASERQRYSQELHDTTAQGYKVIESNLYSAEQELGLPEPGVAEATRIISLCRRLAANTMGETRRSVWALRPEALAQRSSLREAVVTIVENWSTSTGVHCSYEIEPEIILPEGAETVIIRVLQEALTNVQVHSGATMVAAHLKSLDHRAVLQVSDNGIGLQSLQGKGRAAGSQTGSLQPHMMGFGLSSMRERLSEFSGRLKIESPRPGGTTVTASLPITSEIQTSGTSSNREGF